MNGLRWCGSKKEPGIDFKSCPYQCSKQKGFWGQAAAKVSTITNPLECGQSIVFTKKYRKDRRGTRNLLAFVPSSQGEKQIVIDSQSVTCKNVYSAAVNCHSSIYATNKSSANK